VADSESTCTQGMDFSDQSAANWSVHGLVRYSRIRKGRVINSDIASDPLWSGSPAELYREIGLRNGLRATWSQPVISNSDEPLGTFAMYYAEPRRPSASDLQLIEGAAHIALIATEAERSRTSLKKALDEIKKSKAQLETILNTIPTVVWRGEPDGSINYFNPRWHEYKGADGFTYLDPAQFHEYFAADLPAEQAAFMARSQVLNAAVNFKAVITTPAWRSKPAGCW
jgi:PAS domain-containing protein